MKLKYYLIGIATLTLVACGDKNANTNKEQDKTETESLVFKTVEDTVCYGVGSSVGVGLRERNDMQAGDLIADAYIKGFEDAIAENNLIIDLQEGNTFIQSYFSAKRAGTVAQPGEPILGGELQLVTIEDKVSYAIGASVGKGMLQQGLTADKINLALMKKGLTDGISNIELIIPTIVSEQVAQTYFQSLMAKMFESNKLAGEKFLEENKNKEGVVTTESGLQYEIITKGTGPIPTADATVKTHYHGTLIDGTVFDSSVERGEPISFPVMGVIKGWQEALQLMPVGSKWKLYIPYNLAYGEQQMPGSPIKPYSTLIFEVELLAIE